MPGNTEPRLYEGLFLFNPATINSSVAKATEVVQELLDRAKAQAIAIAKWDERKLAYEIRGAKRGLYMLAYFNASPAAVAGIERDVNLSEQVARVLILRADHVGQVELDQAIEAQKNTKTLAALEAEQAAAAEAQAQAGSEGSAEETAPAAE